MTSHGKGANDSGPENPVAPFQSGTTLAQYELIRELGRGGMGAVYLARDTRLGRRVAIKVMVRPDDPLQAERFLAEARMTARCKHDNIVDIYDIGQSESHSYMVLEYVEGTSLRSWLKQQWSADAASSVLPAKVLEICIPLVRALAHAHDLGLVHRDLKPENIMLGHDGSVKVLDFGIAKLQRPETLAATKIRVLENPSQVPAVGLDRTLPADADKDTWVDGSSTTRAGTVMGTIPYMSPEQWLGAVVDGRTDLWAFGIIAWEVCTGKHPLEPLTMERLATVCDPAVAMPSLGVFHPELGLLASVIDGCLQKNLDVRISSAQVLLERLEALGPQHRILVSSDAGAEPANPYTGLAAFQETDADRFFGRDRDIHSMLVHLSNQRVVTVAGASGTGKSSFVRAGVIPALKRSGEPWEAIVLRPGRAPIWALSEALSQISNGTSRSALVDILQNQPGYFGTLLRLHARALRARILVFIDQFEELYTLNADRRTREVFVRCLEGAADDEASPLRVVFSLRADFLDRVAEDRELTSNVTRALVLLPAIGRDDLRQALVKPLERTGYRFEDDALVEQMLDALADTRSPLPLLQFTAAKLWEKRDQVRRCITRAVYEEMGGIAGALSTHADAVVAVMSVAEQRIARIVLTNLVSAERTRAVVNFTEVFTQAGNEIATTAVVQQLAEARLLLLQTDDEGQSTMELVHESLIVSWPKLAQWLDERRGDAAMRARLRNAAKEWDKQGRTEDLVWRGRAAEEAEFFLEEVRERGDEQTLGNQDREFLLAVINLSTRNRRRRRAYTLAAFAGLTVMVIIVSLFSWRANREARRAEEQASRAEAQSRETQKQSARADREAENARAESIQARNATRIAAARERQSDPTLVLALVRELEGPDLPKPWAQLAQWALHQGVARVVMPHDEGLMLGAWSPDGKRIATAVKSTVWIWNADGQGEPLKLVGHTKPINYLAFNHDGRRLATTSEDGTVRSWNADGQGDALIVTQAQKEHMYSAAWSPDDRLIVVGMGDGATTIWRADGGGEVSRLDGHKQKIYSAEYSPDGSRIVTASGDHTARVWNADGKGAPIELAGHDEVVYSASFSPDGRRIATASWDKTARIWDASRKGRPIVLKGHTDRIYSAKWSPNGEQVVTASWDGTIRQWNIDGQGQPNMYTGHRDGVYWAAFSPDASRIASASWDGTVRVWDAHDPQRPVILAGHEQSVYSAAFSHDDKMIVTAGWDKVARIWRRNSTAPPIVLGGHEKGLSCAAFSPDDSLVATTADDQIARVFRADGTGSPIQLSGHRDTVHSIAWSPDGKRVVTASFDKTARIWNADGNGEVIILSGHEYGLYSASFSPDGAHIVTVSADATARVWNSNGQGEPLVLRGHEGRVIAAAYSPDSRRIVTTGWDRTARIWNADGSGQPIILSGHDAALVAGAPGGQGAWSPDGKRVITVSDDKTIRIWTVDGSRAPIVLRAPDIDALSAAFSSDGRYFVTTSHMGHVAKIWPAFEALKEPSDAVLWAASGYCPSIAQRMEILGASESIARRDFDSCQQRVANLASKRGD